MFCPNCGIADQNKNSYCRQCGEFLPDKDEKIPFAFGGETPEKQLKAILFLNLLIGLLCFALSAGIFITFWNKPETYPIVYLAGVLLNFMGFLQIINLTILFKLKKRFEKAKNDREKSSGNDDLRQIPSMEIKELLPEADFADVVPNSVTEQTTKQLVEKPGRKLSQTEH